MTYVLLAGKWLLGLAQGLSRFIRTNPALAAIIALAGLSAWLWHGKTDALAGKARAEHQITLEIQAHQQTKANYRAAQAQAQQAEKDRLARVTAEQQRITAHVSSDYATRLADLGARYERMRRDEAARACAFGSTCGQPVPANADAAGRTYAAAETPGLSLSERYLASQQAEQLDALITWIEQQTAVPVN